jgi:hypothetical protein
MIRAFLVTSLLITACYLNAISIVDAVGNSVEISYNELTNMELSTFSTNRNKGGKTVSETWRGIALIPWLDAKGLKGWHKIKFISQDAYEVELHRIELDNIPAFLAVESQNNPIPNDDLRIIMPTLRESMWLRGLKSIHLGMFDPAPHPYMIHPLDNAMEHIEHLSDSLSFSRFMTDAMYQSSGSIVIVDSALQAFKLDYSNHLSNAMLLTNINSNSVSLNISSIGDYELKDIVYIQCGPFAYASKEYIGKLDTLAKPLGWFWEGIEARQIQSVQASKYHSGSSEIHANDYWVEMK